MEKVLKRFRFGFLYSLVSKIIENRGLILFYIALFYLVSIMMFWK